MREPYGPFHHRGMELIYHHILTNHVKSINDLAKQRRMQAGAGVTERPVAAALRGESPGAPQQEGPTTGRRNAPSRKSPRPRSALVRERVLAAAESMLDEIGYGHRALPCTASGCAKSG